MKRARRNQGPSVGRTGCGCAGAADPFLEAFAPRTSLLSGPYISFQINELPVPAAGTLFLEAFTRSVPEAFSDATLEAFRELSWPSRPGQNHLAGCRSRSRRSG